MIGKLRGIVDEVGSQWLLLDVNGVGYHVFTTRKTLDQMPLPGQPFTLFIETLVREDLINLYGFATAEEKQWFNILTTVQGVGMKAALSILSALSPCDVYGAIVTGQTGALTAADGIGPKLATRIIHELKDKVEAYRPSDSSIYSLSSRTGKAPSVLQDGISALVNLGYRPGDVQGIAQQIYGEHEGIDLQTLIKLCLDGLNKNKSGAA